MIIHSICIIEQLYWKFQQQVQYDTRKDNHTMHKIYIGKTQTRQKPSNNFP